MQALTFQNIKFDIVDRNGQPWLQAAQIAKALSYAREDSVSRIYDRNKVEFTAGMTTTVKLTVNGIGGQQTCAQSKTNAANAAAH